MKKAAGKVLALALAAGLAGCAEAGGITAPEGAAYDTAADGFIVIGSGGAASTPTLPTDTLASTADSPTLIGSGG